MAERQEMVDAFFWKHGPCCSGCDWWYSLNSVVGECHRSAPVGWKERVAMLGIVHSSLPPEAGHILTPREHHCGEFRDTFDWSSLPLLYLKRIGADGKAMGKQIPPTC